MDSDTRGSVGIVDDHPSVITGVKAIITAASDLDFRGEGATVDEFLDSGELPDVVLLDLLLRDDSTPEDNARRLREAGCRVVVFTSGDSPYLVRSAARAGVEGVLLKFAEAGELVEALRAVSTGSVVGGMDWASPLATDPELDSVGLSPRLREVLALYASGFDARRVSQELSISISTVQDYLGRIRDKYALADRPAYSKVELYQRALEDGIVPIPSRSRVSPGS